MNSKTNSDSNSAGALPADLQLIPAQTVRRQARIPETKLWQLEKSGELPALRIGRRRFYRLSDWQSFLARAAKAPPVAVPWNRFGPVADQLPQPPQPEGPRKES